MEKYILMILAVAIFAGCEKDKPIEDKGCEEDVPVTKYIYSPMLGIGPLFSFNIIVRNADGENLLDPETKGNILDNNMSVDYNGLNYKLEKYDGTKPYSFHVLRLQQFNVLVFLNFMEKYFRERAITAKRLR